MLHRTCQAWAIGFSAQRSELPLFHQTFHQVALPTRAPALAPHATWRAPHAARRARSRVTAHVFMPRRVPAHASSYSVCALQARMFAPVVRDAASQELCHRRTHARARAQMLAGAAANPRLLFPGSRSGRTGGGAHVRAVDAYALFESPL
jgi:hypothetical protein